jgi:hypothetical protein
MTTDLKPVLERVVDEESFLAFVGALEADWHRDEQTSKPYGGGGGWENGTIGAFLEAAIAWAEDTKKAPQAVPTSSNPWRRCADILWAGAFYE